MEKELQSPLTPGFEARKEHLINCFLSHMNLTGMIHEAAILFHAPVILTTSLYRVLVMDDLGMEVDDPVWKTARRTGYCSGEDIAEFEIQGITHDVLEAQNSFILDSGLAKQIPRILQKVMIHGKPAAYIGIFQTQKPFTDDDLKTTDLLCDILSIMLEHDPAVLTGISTMHESILSDLLSGSLVSSTVLNDRMRTALWTPDSIFQCVLITPAHKSSGIDNSDYLSSVLLNQFPAANLVKVEEGLLLLLNYDDAAMQEQNIRLLEPPVRQFDLFLNISEPFRSLIYLKQYYESCLAIREVARRQKRESRITEMSDVYFDVLSDYLKKEEKRVLCLPEYNMLAEYDALHQTEYCRTLMTYLETGCSVTESSKLLYVHRNTMTKRLDRICELCGLDYHDGQTLIRFYLSAGMQKHQAG